MLLKTSFVVAPVGTFPVTPGSEPYMFDFADDTRIYATLDEAKQNCPEGFEPVPFAQAMDYIYWSIHHDA